MKVISIDNIKKVENKEDTFLEIILNPKNLMKIPVLIFYHKEQNFKNFLLTYDVENLPLPFSTFIPKILPQLTKLSVAHNLKIGFKGFPRQVFERSILRPGLRWKFEDKFIFFDSEDELSNYILKFGENELKELEENSMFYPLYENKINLFTSEKLKTIAKKILEDFRTDKYYLRKRFVFVDSYPKTNEESSKERFVYYIYNRRDDFEKTFSLLERYFDKGKLNELKKYIKESEQIVISFAIMADDKLRTSIYFTLHDFEEKELEEILEKTGLTQEKTNKIWGIGIDLIENNFSYKLYYEEPTININEIKEYVNEFPLEKKRKLLRFLNSRTKALKAVLLDKKIKNKKFYSKRIDISLQYNSVKIHQLMSLFDIDLRGLADKDLFTLSFEITNDFCEKINFYYALKIPDPEKEREERELYRRNR